MPYWFGKLCYLSCSICFCSAMFQTPVFLFFALFCAQARAMFLAKYGKDFVIAADELRPECGVNRIVSSSTAASYRSVHPSALPKKDHRSSIPFLSSSSTPHPSQSLSSGRGSCSWDSQLGIPNCQLPLPDTTHFDEHAEQCSACSCEHLASMSVIPHPTILVLVFLS